MCLDLPLRTLAGDQSEAPPEPGSPALTHGPCLISTQQVFLLCFLTTINTFFLQGSNTCRKLTDSVGAEDSLFSPRSASGTWEVRLLLLAATDRAEGVLGPVSYCICHGHSWANHRDKTEGRPVGGSAVGPGLKLVPWPKGTSRTTGISHSVGRSWQTPATQGHSLPITPFQNCHHLIPDDPLGCLHYRARARGCNLQVTRAV